MMFDISDSEYEEPRSAFELISWLQEKFEAMKQTGNFSEIYHERKIRNVKKIIEEAVPISRLALYLSDPFHNVEVNLKSGNQNFDAELKRSPLKSFALFKADDFKVEVFTAETDDFKVEVTTTETDETTMRRQALSRQGTVPLTGNIKREKGNIISDLEFVEIPEPENSLTSLLYDRLMKKIDPPRYDEDTVILVHLSDLNPISIRSRAQLIQKTRYFLDENNPQIKGVYFSYQFSNIVDSVESWQI